MGEIVPSNALILERAEKLRLLFNTGHSLHLFQNDIRPTAATSLKAFSECNFDGYLPVTLQGKFAEPKKVIDGEYHTLASACVFTATIADEQTCFGWYVRDQKNVKLSHRFSLPIKILIGTRISVRVDGQVWSTAILTLPT
jgi:hypothetical protein